MPNLPTKYHRKTDYLPYRKQNKNNPKEVTKKRKKRLIDESNTSETASNDNKLLDVVNSQTQ